MDLQTQATAPAPAGYVPDQDDLDQMAKVHSILPQWRFRDLPGTKAPIGCRVS